MGWITLSQGHTGGNPSGYTNLSGIDYDDASIGFEAHTNRWYCNIRLWCNNGLWDTPPGQYGTFGLDRKAGYTHNSQGAGVPLNTQIIARNTRNCYRYYTSAYRMYGHPGESHIGINCEVLNTGSSSNWYYNGGWYSTTYNPAGTIPNPPTINSISLSGKTTSTLDYTINASGSGLTMGYQYGGRFISTGSLLRLSGLKSNTSYTIDFVRVTDAYGRVVQSSALTNTTNGNAPVISNMSALDISETSAQLNYDVAFDTNASMSKYVWKYSTSSSTWQHTVENTNIISDLTPNTLYYTELTVTDNFGMSSSEQFQFTTDALVSPTINNENIVIDMYHIDVTVDATPGSGTITEYGFSKDAGKTYVTTTNNTYRFEDLQDDAEYDLVSYVKNSFNLVTYGEIKHVTTVSDSVVKVLHNDKIEKAPMYKINEDNTLDKITSSELHIILPSNVGLFYTLTGESLSLNGQFREALENDTDYVYNGEVIWKRNTALPNPKPFNASNFSGLFSGLMNVTKLDLSLFNTSGVTDMSNMFSMCTNLTSVNLISFDTSAVTSVSGMFSNCQSLNNVDITSFLLTNCLTMRSMFDGCASLTNLTMTTLDTRKVTNISSMFSGCALETIDARNINTQQVTDMSYLFDSCNAALTINVSNFETPNLVNCESMFNNCINLTTLDLSSFDLTNLSNTNMMFNGCTSVVDAYANTYADADKLNESTFIPPNISFDVKNVPLDYFYSVIDNRLVLNQNFATALATNTSYYNDEYVLWEYDTPLPDPSSLKANDYSFLFGESSIRKLDLSLWNTSLVTNMNSMFHYCAALTDLDITSFDTSNVTDMGFMFNKCSSIRQFDLTSFDVTNVATTNSMFNLCSAAVSSLARTQADADKFNVTANKPDALYFWTKANYLSKMYYKDSTYNNLMLFDNFANAVNTNTNYTIGDIVIWERNTPLPDPSSLRISDYGGTFGFMSADTLDLSLWKTSHVTDMSSMFFNSGFKSLDLSSFDTSNVTNMNDMFKACLQLQTLDISSFNTSNVASMSGMFTHTQRISSLDLSHFDTSNVTRMDYMFSRCGCTTLDISSFNTSNVTSMGNMFNGSKMYSLDLSHFNTKKVQDMTNMFDNAYTFTINISSFESMNGVTTNSMFIGCENITTLDLAKFDASNIVNSDNMFASCANLMTVYAKSANDVAILNATVGKPDYTTITIK